MGQQALNLAVVVERFGLLLQDKIGTHTAPGKFFDVVVVGGAVGVGVEVAAAVVADIFQELDQVESRLDRLGPEAEVLVVAAELLIVQVDMEELAGVPGLGDGVHKVEPGHMFMGHLRVDADHLGVVEGGDEAEHSPGGGQVEVTAGLVGLGLQGESVVVALVYAVFAQEVEGLAEPPGGVERILTGVGLGPFATAPEDVDFGPQLRAQVHGTHGFLQGIGTHLGVVAGESAVAEDGVAEEVGGGHRHDNARIVEGLFEIGHNFVPLGRGGVDRNQVIVVEIHAPGANLGQHVDDTDRRERFSHRLAKGITANIANGPQAKGEFMFGFWVVHL